jgi:hypothetical protein
MQKTHSIETNQTQGKSSKAKKESESNLPKKLRAKGARVATQIMNEIPEIKIQQQ